MLQKLGINYKCEFVSINNVINNLQLFFTAYFFTATSTVVGFIYWIHYSITQVLYSLFLSTQFSFRGRQRNASLDFN